MRRGLKSRNLVAVDYVDVQIESSLLFGFRRTALCQRVGRTFRKNKGGDVFEYSTIAAKTNETKPGQNNWC